MENNYFTMIPNQLFFVSNNDKLKKSLLEETKNYKTLLVLDYLYTNTNRKEISFFTLEDIMSNYNYKPDRHKGSTNDQFRNILCKLQQLGIIITDVDIFTIKSTQLVKCKLNLFKKNDNGDYVNFIILNEEKEKNKILSYENKQVDNLKLLTYYGYIKARMYKSKKDPTIIGGKYENCYPSYRLIAKELNLHNKTIKQYNDILVEMNLIRIANAGLYYFKGHEGAKKESNNIYTLFTGDYELDTTNLKQGVDLYKKELRRKYDNIIFTNSREYKNNDRSKNSFIARINTLEEQGKASQEQIEKRDKLVKEKEMDINDIGFQIQSLFIKYPDMLLSDIYTELDKVDLAENVYKIEKDLGLIDSEDNLIVDMSTYKNKIIKYYKKA